MHSYAARVAWSGSTGAGYEAYDRRHAGITGGEFRLPLSSDASFRGDPACLNPEQLLVLAAASCQLLSFLAVAARARIDVVDYQDDAVGEMPDTSVTAIVLRPRIVVAASAAHPVTEDRVRHLCEVAHRECYIARSVRSEIVVEPSIAISLG